MTVDLASWQAERERDRRVESTTRPTDPAGAAREQLLQWHRRGRGPAAFLDAGRYLAEHGDQALAAARQAGAPPRVLELLEQALGQVPEPPERVLGRPVREIIDEGRMWALRYQGSSVRQIAAAMGLSKSTVGRALAGARVPNLPH